MTEQLICAHCGNPFVLKPTTHRKSYKKRKHCHSEKCAADRVRVRAREKYRRKKREALANEV